MTRMKAYMICDFNNPVSVQYTNIAMKSFEPVFDLIEIIKVQCFVPDTIDACPFDFRISRVSHAKKYKGQNREIPPGERACLTSHINQWFEQAASSERFIIMEHDAYLRDEGKFRALFAQIENFEMWNCGIAMECYSLSYRFARYCRLYWEDVDYEVTSGPMGELFYLYMKLHKTRYHLTTGILPILWPNVYRRNQIVSTHRENPMKALRSGRFESAPVTQCFDASIGSTIAHPIPTNKKNNPDIEHLT